MGPTSVVRRLFHSSKELPPFGGAALQRPPKEGIPDRGKAYPFHGAAPEAISILAVEGVDEGDGMSLVKS
jgi:hypothetical protein